MASQPLSLARTDSQVYTKGLSHAIGLRVLHESPSQKSVRKSVTVGSWVRCDSSLGNVSSPPLVSKECSSASAKENSSRSFRHSGEGRTPHTGNQYNTRNIGELLKPNGHAGIAYCSAAQGCLLFSSAGISEAVAWPTKEGNHPQARREKNHQTAPRS